MFPVPVFILWHAISGGNTIALHFGNLRHSWKWQQYIWCAIFSGLLFVGLPADLQVFCGLKTNFLHLIYACLALSRLRPQIVISNIHTRGPKPVYIHFRDHQRALDFGGLFGHATLGGWGDRKKHHSNVNVASNIYVYIYIYMWIYIYIYIYSVCTYVYIYYIHIHCVYDMYI